MLCKTQMPNHLDILITGNSTFYFKKYVKQITSELLLSNYFTAYFKTCFGFSRKQKTEVAVCTCFK